MERLTPAMNTDAIQFRLAGSDDRDRILAIHLNAFGNEEGPVIVSLLEEMLDDPTAEPIHSFVAESHDEIVGHVLFTSVTIEPSSEANDGATSQILAPLAVILAPLAVILAPLAVILAPLAVTRELQGKGIGTQLVKAALLQLAASGVQLVFVLGDPDYYSRFGFVPAGVRGFQAPYPIPQKNADAWRVLELETDAVKSLEGTIKCCQALDHQKYWVE